MLKKSFQQKFLKNQPISRLHSQYPHINPNFQNFSEKNQKSKFMERTNLSFQSISSNQKCKKAVYNFCQFITIKNSFHNLLLATYIQAVSIHFLIFFKFFNASSERRKKVFQRIDCNLGFNVKRKKRFSRRSNFLRFSKSRLEQFKASYAIE